LIIYKMILTQCAVCATELGLTLGKKCGRCSTRYCGAECQVQHWKEGGHDTLCKKIKKAGGAEQYNANKKYAEAVSVAAEACAEDTKGQTCFICTQALHWKTKEGLVRGCACRGTAGFAHVSCLAEQAKILVAEALENNLDKVNERWLRWCVCSLCEQKYHGVVQCALGWACWRAYHTRVAVADELFLTTNCNAYRELAAGLGEAQRHAEALDVHETHFQVFQRLRPDDALGLLALKSNTAGALESAHRFDDAIFIFRGLMDYADRQMTPESEFPLVTAVNFGRALMRCAATQPGKRHLFSEARSLLRSRMPLAERITGLESRLTLQMVDVYANATILDIDCPIETILQVKALMERMLPTMRRVLGASHPVTEDTEGMLRRACDVVEIRGNLRELQELEESEEPLSREEFEEKIRELEMKSEARNMKLVVE
jgi:hypothetical protein